MVPQAHIPVLADAVVKALDIKPNGIYIDATFGRGGHSRGILAALGPEGRLLVIDRDPDAMPSAHALAAQDSRVSVFQQPFTQVAEIARSLSICGRVNGLLFDLGVSSPQFDDATRGFSFNADGELDMRMDPTWGISAREWLEQVDAGTLEQVLRDLGEERYARRVARAVVAARGQHPITRTRQLAGIVERAVPHREPGKHPATRTFQAIRLTVNRELDQLRAALPQALAVLAPGGRLIVISFHSLEDRVVKRFMRYESQGDPYPPDFPVTADQITHRLKLIGKPTRPTPEEIHANPRSRSAVMRVAERTGAACA